MLKNAGLFPHERDRFFADLGVDVMNAPYNQRRFFCMGRPQWLSPLFKVFFR